MTKVVTIPDLKALIEKHGMQAFYRDLIRYLKEDFTRWDKFYKMPRLAAYVPNGVMELMPTWDDRYFSYKYVNGHPKNTASGRLTVVGLGVLNDVETGYPVLISEMTVLTAIRTSAVSALASDYLARRDVSAMAVIGTGAQSEFQVLSHRVVRPLKTICYFDLDERSMARFRKNMEGTKLELVQCGSAQEAVNDCGIVTTATAAPGHQEVIEDAWIKPGMHLNGVGGDSPGKTELPLATLKRARIFVEFPPQTEKEGEIQRLLPEERKELIKAELWELVAQKKPGRTSDEEITLYDSVGFAVEDYSALRLVYDLAQKYDLGTKLPMVPELSDPKDLVSLLGVAALLG